MGTNFMHQGQPESPSEATPSQTLPGGISKDLLDILICPACRGDLELKPDGSALKCLACRRVYEIRNGIPIMLVAESKVEE